MAEQTQNIEKVLADWAAGKTTLKEIKNYTDEELYAMASVGHALLTQGKTADARVIFEGLVAIHPRNDYYYRALGVIFHMQGDQERAMRQFTYAIRINPNGPHAYINRAEIYVSTGARKEAEADLREALSKINPRDQQLSGKAWALLQAVTEKA